MIITERETISNTKLRTLKIIASYLVNGVIHYEPAEHGRTIIADLYCQKYDRLSEALGQVSWFSKTEKGVFSMPCMWKANSTKQTQEKNKVVTPECLSSTYTFIWFNIYWYSFDSITRIFHQLQNIKKERLSKFDGLKIRIFLKSGVDDKLPAENGLDYFFW